MMWLYNVVFTLICTNVIVETYLLDEFNGIEKDDYLTNKNKREYFVLIKHFPKDTLGDGIYYQSSQNEPINRQKRHSYGSKLLTSSFGGGFEFGDGVAGFANKNDDHISPIGKILSLLSKGKDQGGSFGGGFDNDKGKNAGFGNGENGKHSDGGTNTRESNGIGLIHNHGSQRIRGGHGQTVGLVGTYSENKHLEINGNTGGGYRGGFKAKNIESEASLSVEDNGKEHGTGFRKEGGFSREKISNLGSESISDHGGNLFENGPGNGFNEGLGRDFDRGKGLTYNSEGFDKEKCQNYDSSNIPGRVLHYGTATTGVGAPINNNDRGKQFGQDDGLSGSFLNGHPFHPAYINSDKVDTGSEIGGSGERLTGNGSKFGSFSASQASSFSSSHSSSHASSHSLAASSSKSISGNYGK